MAPTRHVRKAEWPDVSLPGQADRFLQENVRRVLRSLTPTHTAAQRRQAQGSSAFGVPGAETAGMEPHGSWEKWVPPGTRLCQEGLQAACGDTVEYALKSAGAGELHSPRSLGAGLGQTSCRPSQMDRVGSTSGQYEKVAALMELE